MPYRVQIAASAERDLDQSIRYISEVLSAPRAAGALLDEYERALVILADNPSLYGVDFAVSEAVGLRIRHFMVRGYEVFYCVDDEHSTVIVLAFLHGSRDAKSIVPGRVIR